MREKIKFIKYLMSQFMIFFGLKLTVREILREVQYLASAKISDKSEDNFVINQKTLEEALQVLLKRVDEGLLRYVGEDKMVSFKVSAYWGGDIHVTISDEYWRKMLYILGWYQTGYDKKEIQWQKNIKGK